jgi:hypothetical protein
VADDVPDRIADLIRSLVKNLEDPADGLGDWESAAFVLEFPDGRFNSAHGYLYAPDGRISPVAADPWAVGTAVDAYIDGRYRPEEARPRAILVQFDRTSGRYQVLFEDTDENRWNATPRTFRQLREELRPRLQ